jgi:hypothetical protein
LPGGEEEGREEEKKELNGAAAGWERKRERQIRKNRGERETGFPKDLCVNIENYRGLTVKQNFPSIQNSNEEMPKTKVGEFFKLYNIALGLKFKNSKFIFLRVKL